MPIRERGQPAVFVHRAWSVAMSLWDVLVSIFWFMMLFAWIWLLISIFGDLFRDHELSGWGKALWFLVVLFVPLVGLIAYLVVRGSKMQLHAETQMERLGMEPPSRADELTKLADLRERGALTDGEYEKQKAVLLR